MTRRRLNAIVRCAGSDRGSELVEMAIVMPIFLLLLMGIMDFGFLFQRYELVINAAREGARLGAADNTMSDTDIETRVQNYLTGSGLTGTAVADATSTTLSVDGAVVNTKTVTVTYPSDFLFLPGSVNLQGVAVMRVEAGS